MDLTLPQHQSYKPNRHTSISPSQPKTIAQKEAESYTEALCDNFITSKPNDKLKEAALKHGTILFADTDPVETDSHWIKLKASGKALLTLVDKEGAFTPLQKEFRNIIKEDILSSEKSLQPTATTSPPNKRRRNS